MGKGVVVFGSVVQDLISYTPRFPRPGESVRGTSFLEGPGGKGANQAVAAAKLGAQVKLIARVGDDLFGDRNLECHRAAGVDVSHVEKLKDQSTATATITVSEDGENSIVIVVGANVSLNAEAADKHADAIRNGAVLLCQAEVDPEGNRRAMRIAKEAGVTTLFNPAPGDPSLDATILSEVDIVCTNENETEFLTGISIDSGEEDKVRNAVEKMLSMGPHTAIVTMGPRGVFVGKRNGEDNLNTFLKIDVPKKTAVDTTGAGDCFCGSFAYFLTERKDLSTEECVKRAAAVAAESVTRKGTQKSYQLKEELQKKNPELFT